MKPIGYLIARALQAVAPGSSAVCQPLRRTPLAEMAPARRTRLFNREWLYLFRYGKHPIVMAHLDLASLLNFVSTAAIVGALIFTALQVRAANNTRRDQAAVALIQTTQNADWTQALNLLFTLPENATAEQIHAHGVAMERALFEVSVRLESVGYMVFCRTLSVQAVDDLMGGVAIGIYSRSRSWTEEYRRTTGNPRFNEWVEWLADRISERRARSQRAPAHQQYRNWRER